MLDLAAIREALAAQLKAGLDKSLNVYAYVPDSPRFPCIAVTHGDLYVDYFVTFSPSGLANVNLKIIAAHDSRSEDSQRTIDRLLSVGSGSDSSIVDVIYADPTLGGAIANCRVLTATFTAVGQENAGVFEATIPIDVWITRD